MAQKQLSRLNQEVNQQTIASHIDRRAFDFIVVGLGSMGAPTCYFLARQGYSVLGIEQFDITHEKGSHGGQSRLIRMAYFEHPNYVPLLQRSYELWQAMEQQAETRLFYPTGILYSGPPNDFLISGSQRSALEHKLPLENVSSQQQKHRYPQLRLPADHTTVFEYNAGFIEPERAILTFAQQAMEHGVELHTQEPVLAWTGTTEGVSITTANGDYTGKKLIVTSGAWSGKLLPQLKQSLKVTRQLVAWVETTNNSQFMLNKFPCWGINWHKYPGLFYGFPILPGEQFEGTTGLKLGYHFPAAAADPEITEDPDTAFDENILHEFMDEFMPGAYKSFIEFKPCHYTYSPDEHFIVDHYPDQENVLMAAGFSGHGFKFAPVIGEILAEMALNGSTSQPIEFLSAARLR